MFSHSMNQIYYQKMNQIKLCDLYINFEGKITTMISINHVFIVMGNALLICET